jgi:diketogulonate reductase-like aldo/keto reductase
MEAKPFGWTGVDVPFAGQGTWRMGESRRAREREVAALRLGIDLGMTHLDTAEMYGRGGAEEIVAEAIADRRRDDLFLVSKVLPQNASRRGTVKAAESTLQRLRIDHLDLYLLHWPGRYPIGETMTGMDDLVRAGKVRFAGVSNFDVEELDEAIDAASELGLRLACNQVHYQLASRGIERDLLPLCREREIAVVGYTPLREFPGERSKGYSVLQSIGEKHGRTPRQVALRFLTREPELFTIPKAVDPDHVRENAGATGFSLDEDDVAAIDAAFPAPKRRVPLATT